MHLLERVKIAYSLRINGCAAVGAFGVRNVLIAIPNGISRISDPGEAVRACIVPAWYENGRVGDSVVANWTLMSNSKSISMATI